MIVYTVHSCKVKKKKVQEKKLCFWMTCFTGFEVQKAKSEQTILTGSNVVQLGEKGKFQIETCAAKNHRPISQVLSNSPHHHHQGVC